MVGGYCGFDLLPPGQRHSIAEPWAAGAHNTYFVSVAVGKWQALEGLAGQAGGSYYSNLHLKCSRSSIGLGLQG
jgi:hypothetical protein